MPKFFFVFAVLVPALVARAPASYGQESGQEGDQSGRKRVNLSADTFAGLDSAGTTVQMLIGNVRLSQGTTRLRADRATQYPDRDEILFVGNVVVFERGDTLSARRLLYNRSTKVGRASGSVRLTDGDVVVTAPSALYDTRSKRTDFQEGVTLVDTSTVLFSNTGTYWSETKIASFVGEVRLQTRDANVRADSLRYDRETEVSQARGNVSVRSLETREDSAGVDTTSVTTLAADFAFNDRQAGTERFRGDVVLLQLRFDSSGVDTLLMRSKTLRIQRSDTLERMWSVGDVKIWNMETSATSDSVMYTSFTNGGVRRETISLFVNPVAWFESSQIYGETIRIASVGGEPDSLRVMGRTFLAEADSILGRVHQVKGRNLEGRFTKSGSRRMTVGPNAEALYFLKDGDAPNGAVRTTADRIVFEFVDDKLKHVRAEGGVEGTYYPEGQEVEQGLEGFRWMDNSRPNKTDLIYNVRLVRAIDAIGLPEVKPPAPRRMVPARNPAEEGEPRTIAVAAPVGPPPAPAKPPAVPPTQQPNDGATTAWRPGRIDKTSGGYTLIVASRPDRLDAEASAAIWARDMNREGLEVDLFRAVVDGTVYFRIGVGRFNTRAGATRVLEGLSGRVPLKTWILRITSDM